MRRLCAMYCWPPNAGKSFSCHFSSLRACTWPTTCSETVRIPGGRSYALRASGPGPSCVARASATTWWPSGWIIWPRPWPDWTRRPAQSHHTSSGLKIVIRQRSSRSVLKRPRTALCNKQVAGRGARRRFRAGEAREASGAQARARPGPEYVHVQAWSSPR